VIRRNSVLLKFFLSISLGFLCGCSSVKETLGLSRDVPDEFEVTSHGKLEVPEDAKIHAPGSRKETLKPVSLGRIVLGKGSMKDLKPSTVEEKFLELLGAQHYQGIQYLVDQEVDQPLSMSKTFQEKAKNIIIFWKKDKKKPGKVIHAEEEQKRLEKKHDVSA
jgi:hypothetical protein